MATTRPCEQDILAPCDNEGAGRVMPVVVACERIWYVVLRSRFALRTTHTKTHANDAAGDAGGTDGDVRGDGAGCGGRRRGAVRRALQRRCDTPRVRDAGRGGGGRRGRGDGHAAPPRDRGAAVRGRRGGAGAGRAGGRGEIDHRRYVDYYRRPSEYEPALTYGVAQVGADEMREVAGPRKVCIIDSGLDMAHPEFAGYSRVGGTNDRVSGRWSTDENSHGTHVAGTIFAPRNGRGVVGVNPEGLLDVHVIKVFDADGWAYSSSLVGALDRCLDAGSTIVSMSLGGGYGSSFERRAFAEAYANGVLLIAAAGNDGTTGYSYPASYDSVMSVGAVDRYKRHASFSQRNDQVEIAGPGVRVLSTTPGGRYASLDGTSMATPHVSGVAALVWNNVPSCSAAQVRQAMVATAEDLGTTGRDVQYGHGLVRAKATLAWLQNVCGTSSPPATTCADVQVGGAAWSVQGASYATCEWFALGAAYCSSYGGSAYPGNNGQGANEACCVCGGGVRAAVRADLSLVRDNGRTVVASAGSVTDGFDGAYADSQELSVTVQGRNCALAWRELDVEAADNCVYDQVDVRSPRADGTVRVVRYCGSSLPATLQLEGDSFSVVLRSDGSVAGGGFTLDFSCEA